MGLKKKSLWKNYCPYSDLRHYSEALFPWGQFTCTPADESIAPELFTARLSDGGREGKTPERQTEREREINDALQLREPSSSSFVFIDRLLTQTCLISPRDRSSHCDRWDRLKRLPLLHVGSRSLHSSLLYVQLTALCSDTWSRQVWRIYTVCEI